MQSRSRSLSTDGLVSAGDLTASDADHVANSRGTP